MSDAMIKTVGYVLLTVMGIWAMVGHKRLAVQAQKFQREKFNLRVNEHWYRIGALVVGTFFVIFGLIELLNILKHG